jgi:apolipoprotein N-acyltransferase
MESWSTLQSLGLVLPSPLYIFGAVVFGFIGLAAFTRGRRSERATTKWLGVALMVYPYGISHTWLLYAVGTALCAWIVFDRG